LHGRHHQDNRPDGPPQLHFDRRFCRLTALLR
jgi:hypothetical protein